jgi:DNA-binding response OmpR family regulator
MRILIIEDDRDAAQYLAKGLRESGHSAESGRRPGRPADDSGRAAVYSMSARV